jgi:hypothetical protein
MLRNHRLHGPRPSLHNGGSAVLSQRMRCLCIQLWAKALLHPLCRMKNTYDKDNFRHGSSWPLSDQSVPPVDLEKEAEYHHFTTRKISSKAFGICKIRVPPMPILVPIQVIPSNCIRLLVLMRYVLPALPVSGPRGNRARRREAARLAQRQGAARRSGKTRPAVAPPRLSAKFLALRMVVSRANAAMRANQQAKQQAPELQLEFCTQHNIAEYY